MGRAGRTIVTATHELDIVPAISDRVVVLGENRRVLADGSPAGILADRDLLLRANLIHEHLHGHLDGPEVLEHSHPHAAGDEHHHAVGEEAHDHPVTAGS